METALKSFNFGESICHWFRLFCNKSKRCVINNGHLSPSFNLERDCRQGDPLSPYFYIIWIGTSCNRTKEKQLTGIFSNEMEFQLGQYADDAFYIIRWFAFVLEDNHADFKWFCLGVRSALQCFEIESNLDWKQNILMKKYVQNFILTGQYLILDCWEYIYIWILRIW